MINGVDGAKPDQVFYEVGALEGECDQVHYTDDGDNHNPLLRRSPAAATVALTTWTKK